ncbi:hypothetical protein JTE90_013316 [Oedothorax gibbosus]|uniref:Decapping nuclease n=1 Tax=Oedothorax gibbosus TaxID=931172 RepID=A0AAV6VEZ6_9ARAC|nr:hypothetical protein JTE90_013316 [Oedothorax gibbosus]
MYQMLFWIKHHHKSELKSLDPPNKTSKVDFITVRGTLQRIMCTPFVAGFYRNQWEVCATKFNGVIYFTAIDSDLDLLENETMTERHQQYQAWGYKFEQYMTTDKVDGKPDLTSKNHQLEEFCVVLKNAINEYTLLYKAEIDAVIPGRHPGPGSGDTSCYIELKTSRIIYSLDQQLKFIKHKMVTWWAQSYIAGIPEIVCGRRTANGIVTSLQILSVNCLPEQSKDMWSEEDCLNFCDKFLNFLKKTVIEDNYNVVYKFSYKSKDKIYYTKLVNPELRYRVIPEWYKKAMADVKELFVKSG